MSRKQALDALTAYFVGRGGYVVERVHRGAEGTGHTTVLPQGVAFRGRAYLTVVPEDLVELVKPLLQDYKVFSLDEKDEVRKFIDGVVGVVEASSAEKQDLWERWASHSPSFKEHPKKVWTSNNSGMSLMIGRYAGMPTHVSLWVDLVDGYRILFVDPTSQVVDHRIVDEWVQANAPPSARDKEGRVNWTDATNFHNVFPRG